MDVRFCGRAKLGRSTSVANSGGGPSQVRAALRKVVSQHSHESRGNLQRAEVHQDEADSQLTVAVSALSKADGELEIARARAAQCREKVSGVQDTRTRCALTWANRKRQAQAQVAAVDESVQLGVAQVAEQLMKVQLREICMHYSSFE